MPWISQHCKNVVSLIFVESEPDLYLEDHVEYLSSRLKALDIRTVHLTDEGLEKVVQQCPNITHLMLPRFAALSDDSGGVIGRNLKHLKFLHISNMYITDEMLFGIAEQSSSTLEELSIGNCEYLQGDGLNAILRSCSKLRLAQIDSCAGKSVQVDVTLLSNRIELHITSRGVTPAFMDSLAANCTRLQRLSLDWKHSAPYKQNVLTAQRLPQLKVLLHRGFRQSELNKFTLMRPEVQLIKLTNNMLQPNFFDMKF
eukprot:gene11297-13142_t